MNLVDARYPKGLSYEVMVSGHLSAQQIMDTKQFFYKSIVYTVYLEKTRCTSTAISSEGCDDNTILYSLEDCLSSRNKTCRHLYKWIVYFCPFLAHRFGSRFMNNVKRAYITQKKNQTLSKYIEGALDMTICSTLNSELCERGNMGNSVTDRIYSSIEELKTMMQNRSVQTMDYSCFKNSELRDIINNSFTKLSVLCNNVSELDRDNLIMLVQYVTAINGLLSV